MPRYWFFYPQLSAPVVSLWDRLPQRNKQKHGGFGVALNLVFAASEVKVMAGPVYRAIIF